MTEFKKHDRVCWLSPVDSRRLYGYVQGKLRALYIVVDDEGKEWMLYSGELLRIPPKYVSSQSKTAD
jgi:hypothetical protein